jgi:integrase/recombinase XerD
MAKTHLLGPWIRRFLLEYVVNERNLARNTQLSYRDTLRLLLPFVSEAIRQPLDQLAIDQLSPPLVQQFLGHLEQQRGCTVATRNVRLAAIHALARFIALHSPEHVAWCGELRAVPFKKTASSPLAYLDKAEMDALLEAPHRQTAQGLRDYVLLLFLYNTGARASEAAQVTMADLSLTSPPSVRLVGKGNRVRHCPLWMKTAQSLTPLIMNRARSEPVFRNRRQQPITRFGIRALVQRTVATASQHLPSLRDKLVSPHTIRHYLPFLTMSGNLSASTDMAGFYRSQGLDRLTVTRHSFLVPTDRCSGWSPG